MRERRERREERGERREIETKRKIRVQFVPLPLLCGMSALLRRSCRIAVAQICATADLEANFQCVSYRERRDLT
jgi:hypothetical protein